MKGRSFWEHASAADKTCLILNVPVTYPPAPLKGALISDFLTPAGRRDFMHPPGLVEEIEQKFGPYPLYMHVPAFAPNLSDANAEAFLGELHKVLAYKFDVARYLFDKYGCDLMVLHVFETDRLQHELWHVLDEKHQRFTHERHAAFYPEIVAFYQELDSRIGGLLEHIGRDSNVLVVSDHGFARANWLVDINAVLLQAGLIAIKKNAASRLRFWLWKRGITFELAYRLVIRTSLKYFWRFFTGATHADFLKFITGGGLQLFLSEADIDWQRTKAVGKYFNGAIFMNRAGVLPGGSLTDPREIEDVRRGMEKLFRELRNPATGDLIGGELIPRDEAFTGEFAGTCPDFIYLPGSDCHAGTMMGFCSNKTVALNFIQPGHHTMQGILMARGPAFAAGKKIEGARFMDIGPTALHLLGEKVPAGLDGRVLTGLFGDEFAASRPVEYLETREAGRKDTPYTEDDQQDVVDKLKGLGYM